mmetsp:Transcript_44488/g.100451  ORF Transcript_44488/g.100451 Transcript_44488/m.100451 type:complete len:93 (+) Transcript_44488:725-1003(+)
MRENCRMPSLMRVRVGVFKREGLTDSLVKTGQPSLSVGDLPTAVNTRVHHSREERFLANAAEQLVGAPPSALACVCFLRREINRGEALCLDI